MSGAGFGVAVGSGAAVSVAGTSVGAAVGLSAAGLLQLASRTSKMIAQNFFMIPPLL
ncbi:hypothetical protein Pelsub_P1092 [Pelolinea submarina]|nr:hypothetical protein Pelsub_P1092 [Pelolinea submarina]